MTSAPTAAELLDRAEALVPVLRDRAPEAERLRRLSDETIADYAQAGFFSAMVPADRGGSALGVRDFARLVRSLSRGDASAGWIGAFLIAHSTLLYRMGVEAQAEVFADKSYGLLAGVAGPPGQAVPVEGGYRVTGRWRFGSGVMHAEWVGLGALAPDGMLNVVLPVSEIEIGDTWFVPGMRATGSNDIIVDDVFVPSRRATPFPVFASERSEGAPLTDYGVIHYPMTKSLNLIHSAVALGTADAALELFAANVGARTRQATRTKLVDEPITRQVYGRAWDLVHVAGLQLDDALATTERVYGPDAGPATLEDRARINLGLTGSGQKAFAAVDLVARASGASVFRAGDPMDRAVRDAQMQRNHAAVDFETMSSVAGGVLLGAGLGSFADPMF